MSIATAGRLAHSAAMRLWPSLGIRWGTDAFSATRRLGSNPDNVLPLGARGFTVTGCARVNEGYRWGHEEDTALLVHGWGVDSMTMLPLVAVMRRLGYSVASFDAPGHGVSPGTLATMTEYVDAVSAVISALGNVRVIVAHSLGAIAAVGALARRDPGVEQVVLISPTCTLGGVLERWRPTDIALSRRLVDGIYDELHRRNGVPVSYWDIAQLGRDITCPVLAVHDPDDDVVPFTETQSIVSALADADVVEAPGTGHGGIVGSPVTHTALAAFLTQPIGAS